MGISPKQLTINRKDKKMSEENKKEVEKPEEITEEKHDANAEAGSCSWTTSYSCKSGNWGSSTTRNGCGRTTICGTQNSWS